MKAPFSDDEENCYLHPMISNDDLRKQFPDIYEPEAREAILEQGTEMSVKAGDMLMDIGQYIKYIPLVLSGSLKILREDKDGNELLLYYLRPGETCAMSLTCCTGDSVSSIRAVAEEDTDVIAIPVKYMDEWTQEFRSFKHFVLLTYQRRYEELLRTIDGIAFQKLDDRLVTLLKEKSNAASSKILTVTHQELAQELNSSREVISRLLKQLERIGKVKLGRNKIEILASM
jgi:CRP/FNR family transcriptional regulator, anaerobic regulatory protein